MIHAAALATREDVAAAAAEELTSGGSAMDAVLAGYLTLAGATTWALFSPVVFGLAGSGSGIHFIDGRARQPGRGVKNPTRYAAEREMPPLARVAAPGSIAALAVTAALAGGASLSSLAPFGVKAARAAGATERANLIARIGSGSTRALLERPFLDALTATAPRAFGALIGAEDFDISAPSVVSPTRVVLGSRNVALPPWQDGSEAASAQVGAESVLALVAADRRGGLAAAVISPPPGTLPLLGGEVGLPLLAEPVLKGLPRTPTGSPLPCATALLVVVDGDPAIIASPGRRLGDEALNAFDDASPSPLELLIAGYVLSTQTAYVRRIGAGVPPRSTQ